ncbi:MAG: histidine kinase [Bacteroidales bacterium]|nr:histidine kinase [Bacteroidales bacterium]
MLWKKHFHSFVANPFFLSIVPTLIIISLVPLNLNKYSAELESDIILDEGKLYFYDDLDLDGISERLAFFEESNGSGVTIYTNGRIINQWNIKGTFKFSEKECLYISGDFDNDKKKEVYIFSIKGDSVFLSIIAALNNSTPVSSRFIDIAGVGNSKHDHFIVPAEMDDLNGDGIKELIFGINSGFSHYPRRVYAYYIYQDSVVKSPDASYFISGILQADIDGDSHNEIIPFGYASENIKPENAKYHDHSSWLMVLDKNLKFLFEPVEFPGRYSGLHPIINISKGDTVRVVMHNLPTDTIRSDLFEFDKHGAMRYLFSTEESTNVVKTFDRKGRVNFALFVADKGFNIFDNHWLFKKFVQVKLSGEPFLTDIDNDGSSEIIIISEREGKIVIYRSGFYHPVIVYTSLFVGESQYSVTIKRDGDKDPVVSLNAGQRNLLIKYRKNPLWPYCYLEYLFIYLGILCFAMIILKIQHNKLRKKADTEKKISELQLCLIRNQLDPHFTLNAINSVIYSVRNRDVDTATKHLHSFADMYRSLLLSSTSTQRSMQEEINFCENYLSLEKMRFDGQFNYRIEIADDIDMTTTVPRMMIQAYAENAVKHGLAPKKKNGLLLISLTKELNDLLITIRDNGVGRSNSSEKSYESTGKGLKIMDEYFETYNKYYNKEILYSISDLKDDEGKPCGTAVIIRILNYETHMIDTNHKYE